MPPLTDAFAGELSNAEGHVHGAQNSVRFAFVSLPDMAIDGARYP